MTGSPEPIATVIVCEDDPVTLELLCDQLEADRFCALPAPSAADALRLCHFKQPDLLLLDLRLPDGSGFDVLREIRDPDGNGGRYDVALPVIVVSGRASDADRLRGFGTGADDYLTKPVHFAELAMRIRAVLRRRGEARSGPLRAGDLVVDPWRREVRVEGRLVHLAKKEFDLLATLAGDPLRVFSKEELLREVWGFRAPGTTRTLDSHASRLRRKLDPVHRRFVVNVWGYGYRLISGPEAEPEHQLTINGAGW
jgi:DNA-binding response OmpR family regulator